jgi:hypothetical protein
MRKQVYSIFAALALMFTLSVGKSFAQSVVVAQVAFDFTVGTKALPAGKYTFTQLSQTSWAIRNSDSSATALTTVSMNDLDPADDRGRVAFRQYGEHYFLSQISRRGVTVDRPRSRLQRELARNSRSTVQVSVAAGQ